MNWGNKLVVVFVLFAAMIGTLVYKAVHTKFELVSKDYYKDELRYQEQIDGRNNAAKLSKISVTQDADAVFINMPAELKGKKTEGEAWFYCSTDSQKDRKIKLETDSTGRQVILKKELAKGSFSLKLNWQAGGEKYYTEQRITVN